jgi:hypothetical protein
MYQPFDLEWNIRNCWHLCRVLTAERPTEAALKRTYGAAVNALQATRIPFTDEAVVVTFDDHDVLSAMLATGLLEADDVSDGAHLLPVSERPAVFARIADAFEFIRAVNPDLRYLVQTMIGTVIVVRRPGRAGGSVSTATGLIWINPLPWWTIVDYAENIVHEYIHNSIYLSDAVASVFADPSSFERPEAQVTSAILKIPRPYDKAFHSAVVAYGLRAFLLDADQHERAETVASGLATTVSELGLRAGQLTEVGRSFLGAIGVA